MTSAIFAPPTTATGPTPMATEFGLYSVATVVDSNDAGRTGVQYDPQSCGAVAAVSTACLGDPSGELMPATVELDAGRWVRSVPFLVYAGPDADLISYRPEELSAMARNWLTLGEQHAVERGFWTGAPLEDDPAALQLTAGVRDDEDNPAGVEVLAAEPVSGKRAIALLEEALGDRLLGKGVIHAPRIAFPYLPDLAANGARMQTKLRTDVAVGTGYTGSSPADVARGAEEAWIYGTGPVKVTRDAVFDVGGDDARRLLNRRTNEITVLAARFVTVTYECALVGVRVALT